MATDLRASRREPARVPDRGRRRLRARPREPIASAGPFGDKSVVEWPEYTAPAWLGSIADAGPIEPVELRCRRLVARVRVALLCDARAARRRRAVARRPRRPRVREVRGPDAVPRCDELGRTDPTDACRVDSTRRPRRDVLGLGALRGRSRPRIAAADRRARAARKAHRHGREPGRPRDVARATPPPEVLRRPLPAVGQLLPPALGQARSRASAATSESRGSSAPCCATRPRSGPCRLRSPVAPPRRIARTTARWPMRSPHQGYAVWLAEIARRRIRGRAGAMPSIPNLPALIEAVR